MFNKKRCFFEISQGSFNISSFENDLYLTMCHNGRSLFSQQLLSLHDFVLLFCLAVFQYPCSQTRNLDSKRELWGSLQANITDVVTLQALWFVAELSGDEKISFHSQLTTSQGFWRTQRGCCGGNLTCVCTVHDSNALLYGHTLRLIRNRCDSNMASQCIKGPCRDNLLGK